MTKINKNREHFIGTLLSFSFARSLSLSLSQIHTTEKNCLAKNLFFETLASKETKEKRINNHQTCTVQILVLFILLETIKLVDHHWKYSHYWSKDSKRRSLLMLFLGSCHSQRQSSVFCCYCYYLEFHLLICVQVTMPVCYWYWKTLSATGSVQLVSLKLTDSIEN